MLVGPGKLPAGNHVEEAILGEWHARPYVQALKQENEQLRTSNELLRRAHDVLLRENQQLQAKLERLEHVFDEDH